jgi:glycine oxidase
MNYTDGSLSDILIIGGGVIGLAIARQLHKRGAGKITVLERGAIGMEASHAAAGMLAPQAETNEIDDFFHLCNESNKLYPQFAGELFAETGVDIELDRNGTLYLAFTDDDVKEIRHRYAWQRKAESGNAAFKRAGSQKIRAVQSRPTCARLCFFLMTGRLKIENCSPLCENTPEINRIEIVENAEVGNLLTENDKIVGAETARRKFFRRNGGSCNGRLDFVHQNR